MTEFDISPAVSSKMMTVDKFDTFFPCARDVEQRDASSVQVDQTWQHNVREEKDKTAMDVLRELWTGKLNIEMQECFKKKKTRIGRMH